MTQEYGLYKGRLLPVRWRDQESEWCRDDKRRDWSRGRDRMVVRGAGIMVASWHATYAATQGTMLR